jgi:hypothetical protein
MAGSYQGVSKSQVLPAGKRTSFVWLELNRQYNHTVYWMISGG